MPRRRASNRVLATIGKYLGDLEDLTGPANAATISIKNNFLRWGVLHIFETFLNKQSQKLERIIFLYKVELQPMKVNTKN
ncbi:MAG: hypothetical protein KKD44_08975 [Proteobacteria bacterium]|nr:hypothetical protein [Pseudomonadota bacterium]